MAKDGIGTVVGLAAGAGLLWYAYESGWLSVFGLGPTVAPASQPATTPPAATAAPATSAGSGAGTTPTPPAGGPCSPAGVLTKMLALAQAGNPTYGPNGTGTLTMDQGNYYLDEVCTGLSAQAGLIPDVIFPNDPNRGGPLNYNAYAGYAGQHGLSGPRRLLGSGFGTRLVRKGVACC